MESITTLFPLSSRPMIGGSFALKTVDGEQWPYRGFDMYSADGRKIGQIICCTSCKTLGFAEAKALVAYVVCASNTHCNLMTACELADRDIDLTGHVSNSTAAMLHKAVADVKAAS